MHSIFTVSKPYLERCIEGKSYTFCEGKKHNQLNLYNKADIMALRRYAEDREDFVEIYNFTEQVLEEECEHDYLSEWDKKLLNKLHK